MTALQTIEQVSGVLAAGASRADIKDALGALFYIMQHHARHCRACFSPVIDEEGNAGYQSESCAKGREMIQLQDRLEAAFVKAVRS